MGGEDSRGALPRINGRTAMRIHPHLPWALASALAVPVPLFAAEEPGGGGGLFSINLGLSIWTVVIFTVLLLILWRFAWGPILAAVQAREESIQKALDEAARRHEEAAALVEQQRRELAEARRRAQEILNEGRDAAERLRKELEARAREESEAILQRARAEIQREREAALEALRREAVDLALTAASRLVRQKLDAEEDRRLVMEFVEGLQESGRSAQA